MTWLKFFNMFLFQWLFIRLAFFSDDASNGYAIMYPILPLTGWVSDYIPKKHKLYVLTRRLIK